MDTYSPDANEVAFVERFLGKPGLKTVPQTPKLIATDGTPTELSPQIAHILKLIAEDFRAGRAITIISHEARMTTQQAAEFVGVSRPTLIKLLAEYGIPFELLGRHRRIAFDDIQKLKRILTSGQRAAMAEIQAIAKAAGELEDDFADNPLIRD
jgi:excisionase family DNA binding protein